MSEQHNHSASKQTDRSTADNLDSEKCQEVAGHIYEYLDSEMTEHDAAVMRSHVAECSPCLAEMSIDELIKSALKRSCTEQAPSHLRDRIRAQFSTTTITESRITRTEVTVTE